MTVDLTVSTEQLDAAIDYVIEMGAATGASPVSCSSVLASAQLTDEDTSEFMTRFHERCVERDLPPLDCLVVEETGLREGQPPPSYFSLNNQPDPFNGAGPAERVARGKRFLETQQRMVRSWGLERSEALTS